MLRPLILCLGLALLGLGSAQSGGSRANNTFIYPPPKGQGPNLKIGQTITARWSSNFTEINLVLWTDFTGSNGMQSIIRLLSNEANHNSYEFQLGSNIDLSTGSNFYLEVLETDPGDGKETGRRFRTSDFNIVQGPSSAPATITQTQGGTTVVITPSSTPITTGTVSSDAGTMTGDPAAPTDTGGGGGGLPQSTQVGLGVGIGIGVPVAAAAVAALLFFLRRRSSKKSNGLGIDNSTEPSLGVSREKPPAH